MDGVPKIKYENKYIDIEQNTITVKINLADSNLLSAKYDVIRKNRLGFVDLRIPLETGIEKFTTELEKDPIIKHIEYGIIAKFNFTPPDINTNDIYLDSLWYLSAINAKKAWYYSMGASFIKVAVIDNGVDWENPDLGQGNDNYQNIHLNSGEDAWSNPNNPKTGNGIDDDGNGLVDDWKGWNYYANTNDVRPPNVFTMHGTAIAGIIGAKNNNVYGVSGIAGGNKFQSHTSSGPAGVKIIPYCIGNLLYGYMSLLDDAIIDAVDKGVRVIQISLGRYSPPSPAVDDAIQYATDNNVAVVCAAGNDGNDGNNYVTYPASNPNVITVGATNQNNQRASFSDHGTKLDIVAPGVDIFCLDAYGLNYARNSGTSVAAPMVSGTIALMLSVNPFQRVQDIKRILSNTAQKTGGYDYQITPDKLYGTWNEQMGYGLLDAHQAIWGAYTYWEQDLYARDDTSDVGSEPNQSAMTWDSPDIWLEDSDYNRIFSLSNLDSCYIAIRIFNKGNITSSGYDRLHLYWTKKSLGSVWPQSWDVVFIAVVLPRRPRVD